MSYNRGAFTGVLYCLPLITNEEFADGHSQAAILGQNPADLVHIHCTDVTKSFNILNVVADELDKVIN